MSSRSAAAGVSAVDASEREAVVFLDGLSSLRQVPSVEPLAKRLARAIDQQAHTRAATFVLGDRWVQSYGEGEDRDAQAARIIRRDTSGVETHLDVFVVDYLTPIARQVQARPSGQQLLLLCWILLKNSHRLPRALLRPRRVSRKAWQVFWSGLVLFVLGAYFVLLAASVAGALLVLLGGLEPEKLLPEAYQPWAEWALERSTYAVPVMVALQSAVALIPARVRGAITAAATGFITMLEYMSVSMGRAEATDHLPALLEALENERKPYTKVHVVAYSFGSIVALDTLFPTGSVRPLALERVQTLTTIGCPMDVFAAFWPKHFHARFASGTGRQWVNVVLRGDPLASTFEQDSALGLELVDSQQLLRPQAELEGRDWGKPQTIGFLGAVLLGGMKLHTEYWERSLDARSCFDVVVPKVFGNTTMMA